MSILSIQSHVVYGHAGNSAAVFPLQRLGNEVWAINTVEFSNHTGYGAWTGNVLDADLVHDLLTGLQNRGVLPQCQAVLSGYLGDASTGKAVLDAVHMVRQHNPQAIYCCDPVMGDTGRGFYVKPGIPELFKNEVLPVADIITPNQFELEALTGIELSSDPQVYAALEAIHTAGPRIVLVTSFCPKGTADDSIGMLVSDGTIRYRTSTPKLPFPMIMAGSGDLTTAVFLSYYLKTGDTKQALEQTTGAVYSIMLKAFTSGGRELPLVEAQKELDTPSFCFTASPF
jgi:pyridoxine kinase